MGQAASSNFAAFSLDSYINELSNVKLESSLGSSRFLKTVRAKNSENDFIIVKIYPKPDPSLKITKELESIIQECKIVGELSNVLSYFAVKETERAGYIMRPFVFSNLYDRISTRPFLSTLEKKWITFQLLQALASTHQLGIHHGDIKTENCLVTSTNWVYLTDFASFKPCFLPEDDPSPYSFFFDSSSRHSCYVAPERFVHSEILKTMPTCLTPEMDIFSLGCVIAELFLEGTSIFSFADLLRYRDNQYSPKAIIQKIEDENIQALILHMIQIDPSSRFSAQKYLLQWKDVFPAYFDSFLYQYMVSLNDNTLSNFHADNAITKIYQDFDKIALALNLKPDYSHIIDTKNVDMLPVQVSIPNFFAANVSGPDSKNFNDDKEAGTILLSVICSHLRSLSRRQFKSMALDMILVLGRNLNDLYKLDRCIPFLMTQTVDQDPYIRSISVRMITDLLSTVEDIPTSDVDIFIEYILPQLHHLVNDQSVLVRMSYAACIATLAETAQRFLETAEIAFQTDSSKSIDIFRVDSYDSRLSELRSTIETEVTSFLLDSSNEVKQCLLQDITNMCMFFGKAKTNEMLLSHVITYLNDRDWRLRSSFFESIVGIGTFLGSSNFDQYLFPLLLQGIFDHHEAVIERVLLSLKLLSDLSFFSNLRLRELVTHVGPLLLHPSSLIKSNVIQFVTSASKNLSVAEVICFMMPVIRTYLKHVISEITPDSLQKSLLEPIPRDVYEMALTIAMDYMMSKDNYASTSFAMNGKSSVHFDRKEYLVAMGAAQISAENQTKIIQMLPLIEKTSKAKLRSTIENGDDKEGFIPKKFVVTPHTVFLSKEEKHGDKEFPPKTRHSRIPSLLQRPNSSFSNADLVEKVTLQLGKFRSDGNIRSSLSDTPFNFLENSRAVISPKHTRQSSKSLINQSESMNGKAKASISTTVATVTAQHDFSNDKGSPNSLFIGRKTTKPAETPIDYTISPQLALETLLRQKTEKAFPSNVFDMGPKVLYTINPRSKRNASKTNQVQTLNSWRPKSTLVANFKEHQGPVNGLVLSSGQSYFVSCSDDGTVKAWDCFRLEKSVVNKSVLTYKREEIKFKCLCFGENSHCVFVGSDDGKIEVLMVEMNSLASQPPQYDKFSLLKSFSLENEIAVQLSHYHDDVKSILVVATDHNNVYGYDLNRNMTDYSFKIPFHYGIITCYLVDQSRKNWILCGTSRGILACVDVKFGIILNSWLHPTSMSIKKLYMHPFAGSRNKKVIVSAGDNEFSVWDLEKFECKEVFCARNLEDKIGRYARTWKSLDVPNSSVMRFLDKVPTNSDYNPASINGLVFVPEANIILTAGSDKKIRCWDLSSLEKSYVIGKTDGMERLFTSHRIDNITFNHEKTLKSALKTSSNLLGEQRNGSNQNLERRGSNSSTSLVKTQLSLSSEEYYKYHVDAITQLIITEYPYPMVISADRKGLIKELSNTVKKAPANMTIGYDNNDITRWHVVFQGPDNTPYKGGSFALEIVFSGEFPFKPPQIKFKTKIFHPNIDDDGSICVAILKLEVWKPATSVLEILTEIYLLLSQPNPDDPLSTAKAEMYVQDRVEYDLQAAEWTKKYARG